MDKSEKGDVAMTGTTRQEQVLELADIQGTVLRQRPSPYTGAYFLLRIDDPADGRRMLRRLAPRFGCSSGPSLPPLFRRGLGDSPFVSGGRVTRSPPPSARYRSRGLPPPRARRAAAASATATTIRPCTLFLLHARRATAASATSLITCCRRRATRD